MAGDHKCPVCSSTFTRPQHVARHMRSHTGDRPYKCVHCGDQFARSDLLSRHVNKCHASEKPPTTTQPARRKGHAQPGSSSTTGVRGPAPPLIPPPGTRKICDSCARSRTPAQCDSGLPCGKCLQRNTKCTYVEARRPPPGAAASRQHDLLSNPSVPLTVPSMAAPRQDSIFPSQPAFNFTVPLYPQNLDPRSAASSYRPIPSYNNDSPHPPSLSLSASTSESVESPVMSSYDFAVMLSQRMQSNMYPNANIPAHNIQPPPPQYPDAGQKPLDPPYMNHQFDLPDFLYNNAPVLNHQQPTQQHALMNGNQPQQQQQYGLDLFYNEPTQRGLVSDYTHVYQIQPQQNQAYPPPPQQQQQQRQAPEDYSALREGGFSSAFGLMSLDDPAVAAEMNKGNSFFTPAAANAAVRNAALKQEGATPGRDANIAELRDFWKAFMRDNTPGEKPQTPAVNNGHADRPTTRRSLSKMASLPDIKTPPIEGVPSGPLYSTAEEPRPHAHAEDLSSYQQAVLARKTPSLTLAPPPRKRNTVERPSFKRLASQTLGPFETKSVKISHPGAVEAIAAYERYGGHGQGQGHEPGRRSPGAEVSCGGEH